MLTPFLLSFVYLMYNNQVGIFSKKERTKKRILAVDLDSSYISVLYLERNGTVSEEIFSAREPIRGKEAMDPEQFLYHSLSALKSVLGQVFAKRLPLPDKILCLLSSPWYVSEVRKIRLARKVPFIFTAKLADELFRSEAKRLQKVYVQVENIEKRAELEPIEMKTMKTTLNGYTASSPLGRKAKELELSVFVAMAPREVLEKIRNTTNGYFTAPSLKFASSCFASFSAVRNLFPESDFLLVEVDGEITDLSLVKKGELCGFMSFPFGYEFFPRRLSELLNISHAEAVSLLSLLSRGQAERSVGRRTALAMKEVQKEWREEFERSLSGITEEIAVPFSVILSTVPEFSVFFQKTISQEQSHQYDWAESKFRVTFLSKSALRSLYLSRFV